MRGKQSQLVRSGGREAVVIVIVVILAVVVALVVVVAVVFIQNKNSTLQYNPRNMHTVLLCFALLWLCSRS